MKAFAYRQRGVSFVGMIFIATGLILVAILGLKMIPPYVYNAQIAKIFQTIASDPAMRDAPIREILEAYNKRATVNSITAITAEDIEVIKEDGVLSLSAKYSVKIPLAGNVSMVLEFNPSSS